MLPPPIEVDGTSAAPRHDEFYKYWDRFMRVKEKTKGRNVASNDSAKKAKATSVSIAELEELNVPTPASPVTTQEGPSLEKDVEGRPVHPVWSNAQGVISKLGGTTSLKEAAASCRAKVEAIIEECRRLNQKYYDRTFNLPMPDTLLSLDAEKLVGVGSVKRIEDIYEDPRFIIDGITANDVRQGTNGDCWFLAAITALSEKSELIKRLCVHQDEKVGVYGFVFFRDGEWISEVVDDRLCLRRPDDTKAFHTEHMLITSGDQDPSKLSLKSMRLGIQKLPKEFRDSLRKGSDALYFASCKDSNETWLPLMEKAYAKAHGDYQSIEGGFTGEGIEDLTGGIATYISSEDVMDKEKLWSELLQVNVNFLFGCGSRSRGGSQNPTDDEGFVREHAYTVLAAQEVDKPKSIAEEEKKQALKAGREYTDEKRAEKLRLLKLRNPWGRQEWNGAWSDGSKEWTPEVMKQLNHTFGDDGIFWISFPDFLKYYPKIDRIRLIGEEWTVTQQWTTVKVPWTAEFLDTSFGLTVEKDGPVVLVLNQPDSRYFKGLTGRYSYNIHFRLYKDGEDTYMLRSMEGSGSSRSCKAELDLKAGNYTILVQIAAARNEKEPTAEEVFRRYRKCKRDKLIAVGKSFDAVHSKGKLREMEERDVREERREARERERQEKREERERDRSKRLRLKKRRQRIKLEMKRKKEEKMREAREKKKFEREQKAAASDKTKKRMAKEEEETAAERPTSKDTQHAGQSTTPASNVPSPAESSKVTTSSPDPPLAPTTSVPDPPPSANVESTTVTGEPEAEHAREEDKEEANGEHANEEDKEEAKGEPKSTSAEDATLDSTGNPSAASASSANKEDMDKDKDDEGALTDCAISSVSSVQDADFPWEAGVDGSESESESETEWGVGRGRERTKAHESDTDEDDMFKGDAWVARCVLGLRVCSRHGGVGVRVKTG